MKKILLTAAIILAAVVCGNAESRTFVREYYYQAGESDSKISCLQSVKDTKFGQYTRSPRAINSDRHSDYNDAWNYGNINNMFTLMTL